ncbi:MAG: PEP-CTERM sorting domain-containing protein [Prosthecobacter sp.]
MKTIIAVLFSASLANAASVQLYYDYDVEDLDTDGYLGGSVITALPTYEIPTDYNDINPFVNPGAFDNPTVGNENGMDEDQDGIIDGVFVGPLTFAALGGLQVAAGEGFDLTLDISGIDSSQSIFLQAFASGTVFNPVTRHLSWTSQADDAGQTFEFSVVASALSGATTIQRQFSVSVAAVPEPTISAFLGFGLAGLVLRRRRK